MQEASQLPRSRLRLTALNIAREARFASVKRAGDEDLAQNLDSGEGRRVVHQRQIDEILDCPAPEQ